jgi:hypothetical protein
MTGPLAGRTARPAYTCPDHVTRALDEVERRVVRLIALEARVPADDAVAAVAGSGEPPD